MQHEEIDEQVYFLDEEDLRVFAIDKLKLKAETIQNYILPKLEHLLKESVQYINKVFDTSVFDNHSTVSFSPNYRKERKTDYFMDYHFASYSLGGTRKPIWKGVTKEGEKFVDALCELESCEFDDDEAPIADAEHPSPADAEFEARAIDAFKPRYGLRWQVFERDNFRCVAC